MNVKVGYFVDYVDCNGVLFNDQVVKVENDLNWGVLLHLFCGTVLPMDCVVAVYS
jgi:hypothetical protein